MAEILTFVIAFLVGLLYFRILFLLFPGYFNKPFTRTTTGYQVHHLHFGIVFTLMATYILLAFGPNLYVFAFLGLGLGQMFDLFIASIKMKGDRPEELKLYKESFAPTLILGSMIIAVALIVTYLGSL